MKINRDSMPTIYHITTQPEWEAARQKGFYESPSLREEGFIHCSEARQIEGVLKRYFSGKEKLLKLAIDSGQLTSRLFYDWSPSSEDTFPHIYGPINLNAITGIERIN